MDRNNNPQFHAVAGVSNKFAGIASGVTPRQDRLSGVIICPAIGRDSG